MSESSQQPVLTRGQFLLSGATALGASILPFRFLQKTTVIPQITPADIPRKQPVQISELSRDQALEWLELWNTHNRTHQYTKRAEPPLSLVLSLLIHKGRYEIVYRRPSKGHCDNKLTTSMREFFTQIRVQRILQAVSSGEADNRARRVLQTELNKTGVTSLRMAGYPWFAFHYAYLRMQILECFDPQLLNQTLGEKHRDYIQKMGY